MADQSMSVVNANEEEISDSTSELSSEEMAEDCLKWREPSESHKWCDAERTDYNFQVQKTATVFGLFFIPCSMFLYTYDVVSDIWLASNSFQKGEPLIGSLILAIVFFNSLTVGYFSIKWHKQYEREYHLFMPWWYRYFCFLGPLPTSAFAFYYGCKSRKKNGNQSEMHYKKMWHLLFLGSKLSVIEALMESSLQLLLQIYLFPYFKEGNILDLIAKGSCMGFLTHLLKIFSIITSWMNLAITLTTNALRGFFSNIQFVVKDDTSFYHTIRKILWIFLLNFIVIGYRILIYSIIASLHNKTWFWVFVLHHVIIISATNWFDNHFRETIAKETANWFEWSALHVLLAISTLFTFSELKPQKCRTNWRLRDRIVISFGELLALFIQLITAEDDPNNISWFWFYFCTTLYNCFWWTRCRNSTVGGPELIFYVAIETMDGYVFVIELDKPIIGKNPNEETIIQEMSDVQMVHDSNPFNELTNSDIVRSVRYRPRRVSV